MANPSHRPSRSPATEADLELFRHIEANLYTAVISDSLDELGYRNQAFREFIRPLSPDDRFAGWARTFACVDVYHIPSDPYVMEIEAMDSILPVTAQRFAPDPSKLHFPIGAEQPDLLIPYSVRDQGDY